jgi:hypothetical protein
MAGHSRFWGNGMLSNIVLAAPAGAADTACRGQQRSKLMPERQIFLATTPRRPGGSRIPAGILAHRAEVKPSTIGSPALWRADTDAVRVFALQAATLAMPGALSQ